MSPHSIVETRPSLYDAGTHLFDEYFIVGVDCSNLLEFDETNPPFE